MTHREQLVQLFSELGISCAEREPAPQPYTSEEGMAEAAAWESAIDIPEGIGLPGYVASFYFDAGDSFLAHRIWKKV